MSDNFLQQIKTTEANAQKMVQEAQEKAQHYLEEEKKKLEKQRSKNLEIARSKAKKKVFDKQSEMKSTYNDLVSKKQKDIRLMEKSIEEKQEKVLSTAYHYFLNNLI